MPGAFKHGIGCNCCECPQSLFVNVRCRRYPWAYGNITVGIGGVTVLVRNAEDTETIASCTTNATGGCGFNIVHNTPVTYKVKIESSTYKYAEATVTFPNCRTHQSVELYTCLAVWDAVFQVNAVCPVAGAEVVISGDISGSGITDADGLVRMSFNAPSGCGAPFNYTATITPPLGSGLASLVESRSSWWAMCSTQYELAFDLIPDDNHVSFVCPITLPKQIEVVTSDGTFIATWQGNRWVGFAERQSGLSCVRRTCTGIPEGD